MRARRHDPEVAVRCPAVRERTVMFDSYKMARALLGAACVATSGCVIPVPADLSGADAGVKNADPVITDGSPVMPGPWTFIADTKFNVTLRDADKQDVLYIRVFRNYVAGNYGHIYQTSIANDPVNGTEIRGPVDLPTAGWCLPSATFAGTQLIVDVLVADRPFSEDTNEMPMFRALADKEGKSNIRSWVIQCPVVQ